MSNTIVVDAKGRIVIPGEILEKHGDRYRIVDLDGRVELIPLADDPVEGLRAAVGDAFDDRSIAEIKREAHGAANEAAMTDASQSDH